MPRLMWRVSVTETRSSLMRGRDPAHACTARACRKPGTRASPASSICCTSCAGIGRWSGSVSLVSVVPMTQTVWTGTRMSPSAGWISRLTTLFTSRWFIATMIPRPGTTGTGGSPVSCEIWPAHGPAQLRTNVHSMTTSSSRRWSWQWTARTWPSATSIFVTGW